jgi:hypothetical protein
MVGCASLDMAPVELNTHHLARLALRLGHLSDALFHIEILEPETAHLHWALDYLFGRVPIVPHLCHARAENRRRDFVTLLLGVLRDSILTLRRPSSGNPEVLYLWPKSSPQSGARVHALADNDTHIRRSNYH